MKDNGSFKQIGSIFGVPLLLDLTDTVPEDRAVIIDKSQMVIQKSLMSKVKYDTPRGKTVAKHCKRCGDIFFPRVVDVARGWGKFCSKSCKAEYQTYGTSKN